MQFLGARFGSALGVAAALAWACPADAQPAAAASGPSPSERAQRDADKVFRMILQHADKPRRTAREEAAPAAAVPRAPASPAARTATPSTAPARPAETRVTSSTPPAVSTPPPQVESPVAAPTPAAPVAGATDTAGAADPAAATLAPVAALAPVAVAAPRSLKLELVSSVEPEFPPRLLRSLGSGSVVVNFQVRPDGTVASTEVARSSHRGLNEAAQAAVAAWRFKPLAETLPGVVELKFE